MRVDLSRGKRRLKHRLMLRLVPLITGYPAPDVLKVLTYRSEIFGACFSALTHETMRGESHWSPGQRELFAAFTSKVNECRF